jgi:hypothetical protein
MSSAVSRVKVTDLSVEMAALWVKVMIWRYA